MSPTDIEASYVQPKAVPNWIHPILEHMEECYEESPFDFSHDEMAELLLSGRWGLWVATRNGALVGHATTTMYTEGGKRYVHLPHMWTAPGEGPVIEALRDAILPFAKSIGAFGISFKTGRMSQIKAWTRRLKAFGMKPAMLQFHMEM